jgi:hypothetical protein
VASPIRFIEWQEKQTRWKVAKPRTTGLSAGRSAAGRMAAKRSPGDTVTSIRTML